MAALEAGRFLRQTEQLPQSLGKDVIRLKSCDAEILPELLALGKTVVIPDRTRFDQLKDGIAGLGRRLGVYKVNSFKHGLKEVPLEEMFPGIKSE